jgi:hypothetical protein
MILAARGRGMVGESKKDVPRECCCSSIGGGGGGGGGGGRGCGGPAATTRLTVGGGASRSDYGPQICCDSLVTSGLGWSAAPLSCGTVVEHEGKWFRIGSDSDSRSVGNCHVFQAFFDVGAATWRLSALQLLLGPFQGA